MKQLSIKVGVSLVCATIIAGCGGGGGDSGNPGSPSGGRFYPFLVADSSDNILRMDAAGVPSLQSVKTLTGSGLGDTGFGMPALLHGRVDSGVFSDPVADAVLVVYNRRLTRIGLSASDQGTRPVLADDISTICSLDVIPLDLTDSSKSWVLYQIPGSNNECFDDDDVQALARISDGSKVAVSNDFRILNPFYDETGKASSFLVYRDGSVVLLDGALSAPRQLINAPDGVGMLLNSRSNALIATDSELFRVSASGAVSTNLYPAQSGESKFGYADDGSAVYLLRSYSRTDIPIILTTQIAEVLKIPVDGTAAATSFLTLEDQGLITSAATTDGTFTFVLSSSINTGASTSLRSVPLSNGSTTPQVIEPASADRSITLQTDGQSPLFYSLVPTSSGSPILKMRSDAGVVKSFGTDSFLEYRAPTSRQLVDVAQRPDSSGTFVSYVSSGRRVLSVINHSTSSETVLKADIDLQERFVPGGFGNAGIGSVVSAESFEVPSDVFYYDVSSAKAGRLTSTTNLAEIPLF